MPKTILVVDDNDSIRSIYRMTLQYEGYTVIEASDGQEALRNLESNEVHLVVTDIVMENMTGLELLDRIRSDPKHADLPVVICSAERGDTPESLLERGANAVLPKPCRPKKLLQKVQGLLP